MKRLSCEEARSLFEEAEDGSLDEPRARSLSEHLAGCAECRAERAELLPVLRLLAGESEDPMAGLPDPGTPYWVSLSGRIITRRTAELAIPKPERTFWGLSWLTQPRLVFGGALAFAASVALVAFVYAPRGGLDLDDPTIVADFVQPHSGSDPFEPVRDLSADEVDQVEDDLLAASGGSAKKPAPSPTPVVTAAPKASPGARAAPRPKAEGDSLDEAVGQGHLDLDDLSPEEMDQLLDQLGAKKT